MSEIPKTIGGYATTLKTFLFRLINGEYGLARTYWLFGVVGVFALLIASLLVSSVISYIFEPLGTILFLISVFVIFAYGIAAMIGAWRAASQYEGPHHWALLTKLAIAVGALPAVLFILFFMLSIVSIFLQPFMMRDMPATPPEPQIYDGGKAPVTDGQRIALTPRPPLPEGRGGVVIPAPRLISCRGVKTRPSTFKEREIKGEVMGGVRVRSRKRLTKILSLI